MEFVQLQINYADWEDPLICSRRINEIATRHGKPVIVMEPVKGGKLANPPQPVKDILQRANPDASFASWAVRFAASLPNVMVVLSGMSNMEQMEDNLSSRRCTGFGLHRLRSVPGSLSAASAHHRATGRGCRNTGVINIKYETIFEDRSVEND